MMKFLGSLVVAIAIAVSFAFTASAETGKTVTLNGKGCCVKCCLKEGTECQNAVTVEKDGKKTTYYLVDNDVSKKFHENICKAVKPVTVTGTCKKVDGKLQVTATSIELAK